MDVYHHHNPTTASIDYTSFKQYISLRVSKTLGERETSVK